MLWGKSGQPKDNPNNGGTSARLGGSVLNNESMDAIFLISRWFDALHSICTFHVLVVVGHICTLDPLWQLVVHIWVWFGSDQSKHDRIASEIETSSKVFLSTVLFVHRLPRPYNDKAVN